MPDPRIREVWRIEIPGIWETKSRWCVVISVDDERIEVVYGGGTPHPGGDHLAVSASSPLGQTMGLTKDTYFRFTNVAFVKREAVRERVGECLYEDFLQFEIIAFDYQGKR